MMFIRRPIEKWHSKSKINLYDLNRELDIIFQLKKDIEEKRETVSNLLYQLVDITENKQDRNRLIVSRRKIYNTNKPYSENIENLIMNYRNRINLKVLEEDMDLRKKLFLREIELNNHLEENTVEMQNYLKYLCKNDEDFLIRIKVANPKLYDNITKNSFGRSQYMTLLKYLYKQETCCTPSSFWSGISIVENKKIYNNQYWSEENRYFGKIEFRNEIIKDIRNGKTKDITFIINPTVYEQDNYFLFTKFDSNHGKVFKLKSNDILTEIINNQVITYDDIFQIFYHYLGNYMESINGIVQLIEYQLIVPQYPYQYGYYNLNAIKYPDILNNTYTIDSDKNFGLFLGNSKEIVVDSSKLRKNMEIYNDLQHCLYEKSIENTTISEIKEYIRQQGRKISLKEFLYQDFDFTYVKDMHERNYKCWRKPKDPHQQLLFDKFIDIISNEIKNNPKKRNINLEWLNIKRDLAITHNDLPDCEVIYRLQDDIYCLEMLSTQIGRLLLRYIKYCPDDVIKDVEFYFTQKYSNPFNLQVNLELNNDKDNIGFNIPGVTKFLSLYNRNSGYSESLKEYTIEDVFITLKENELVLVDKLGCEFNILFSSTITPSGHKLYKLLNLIKNGKNGHLLNSPGLTRVELDLDYQPRICIDNLLISRERFRLDCSELKKETNYKGFNEKLINIMYSKGIPFEYYYYSDTNFKPYYGRLDTKYDILTLKRHIHDCDKYVYFEEVFPCPDKGKYAIEYWEALWEKK